MSSKGFKSLSTPARDAASACFRDRLSDLRIVRVLTHEAGLCRLAGTRGHGGAPERRDPGGEKKMFPDRPEKGPGVPDARKTPLFQRLGGQVGASAPLPRIYAGATPDPEAGSGEMPEKSRVPAAIGVESRILRSYDSPPAVRRGSDPVRPANGIAMFGGLEDWLSLQKKRVE